MFGREEYVSRKLQTGILVTREGRFMLLSIDQRTMIYSIFGFSKGGLKTKSES